MLRIELESDAPLPVKEVASAQDALDPETSKLEPVQNKTEECLPDCSSKESKELGGTRPSCKEEKAKDATVTFNINSSLLITDSDSLEYKSFFSLTQEKSFQREAKVSPALDDSSYSSSQVQGGTSLSMSEASLSKNYPLDQPNLPAYKKVASEIVENILTTVNSALTAKRDEEREHFGEDDAPKVKDVALKPANESSPTSCAPSEDSQPKKAEEASKELPVIVGSALKFNKLSNIKAMFENSNESHAIFRQEYTIKSHIGESLEQKIESDREYPSEEIGEIDNKESARENNIKSTVSEDKEKKGETDSGEDKGVSYHDEFLLCNEDVDKERRRIIDNQVVRIKPQETWKGVATYQEQNASPSNEKEDVAEEVDCVLTSTLQQSLASYKERKSQQMSGTPSSVQDASPQQDVPRLDDTQDDGVTQDLVDSDSILEKKEQLKKFWEHKMLSEKSNKGANKTWVTANNDHNVALSASHNGDAPKTNGHVPEEKTLTNGHTVLELSVERQVGSGENTEKNVFKSELAVGSLNGFKQKTQENGHKDVEEEEEENAPLTLSQDTGIQNDHPPSLNSSSTANDNSFSTESKSEQLSDFSSLDSSNDKIIIEEKPPEPKSEPPSGGDQNHSDPKQIAPISTWKKEESENIEPITIVGQELAKTNHVHKPSTRETSLKVSGAESMIAQEIRMLKEREEELRRMREKMSTFENQATSPPPKAEAEVSKVIVQHYDAPRPTFVNQQKKTLDESQRQMKMQRTVSLDCLHGTSYGHGHRRKTISVKPLADNDEKPNYWSTNETPVEREIRLAKEREENLKREREMLSKSLSNGFAKEPQKLNSFQVITQQKEATKGNTQRMLATSRIQQEIEEQTRKELDLRDAGHIKTISHERTTGVSSPLSELISSNPFKSPAELSPRSPSPEFNGRSSNSSTNSSSSMPPVRRVHPPQPKAVSMKRFIASRGKELAFSTFNFPAKAKPEPVSSPVRIPPPLPPSSFEMKPPQVRKDSTIRKNVSAESKIKDELTAMKAREEELRQQRMRLLGKSHPNLAMINGDSLNEDTTPADNEVDGAKINGTTPKENGTAQIGGPRKRSSLIAKWEQRIQQIGGEPINA